MFLDLSQAFASWLWNSWTAVRQSSSFVSNRTHVEALRGPFCAHWSFNLVIWVQSQILETKIISIFITENANGLTSHLQEIAHVNCRVCRWLHTTQMKSHKSQTCVYKEISVQRLPENIFHDTQYILSSQILLFFYILSQTFVKHAATILYSIFDAFHSQV